MIPQSECIKGHLYRIDSRNLSLGVYDGKGGFIGIRTKFNSRYLFTELYWEASESYGTVRPQEDLGPIPADIPAEESVVHDQGREWAINPETGQEEAVVRRDSAPGEPPHGRRHGFVDLWVSNGQRLPDDNYPYGKENYRLFEWLDEKLVQ